MSDVLPPPTLVKALHLNRLSFSHFRCYEQLRLECEPTPLVLTGPNGAGKTNILEAISFLSPGRGLRNAKLTDIDKQGKTTPWAIAAWATTNNGEVQQIGTGRSPEHTSKRIIKVDGQPLKSQSELARLLSVVWLTPQMDQLFLEGSSERRQFLDRLVFNFDAEHAKRINQYEFAMRERARLLRESYSDPAWLSSLESRMAESAVAIAAARLDAVEHIQAAIYKSPTVFPKAILAIEGMIEGLLKEMPAVQVEVHYLQQLQQYRGIDANAGRTHLGTHRSDLIVHHAEKRMPAALCSTGEQKALLLSIILAEARAKALWKQCIPILLLDEVVAHLDPFRRAALFDEILDMGAQAWLTGTDAILFEALQGKAQFLRVEHGTLTSETA